MGCNCGAGRRKAATAQYQVTYPDGRTVIKNTELGAKLAVQAAPGATYAKVGAPGGTGSS